MSLVEGVIHDMPPEEYHAAVAMSSSGLRHMAKSPAHFFGMQLDPNRPPPNPTPAMEAGTLFHTALFEPEKFDERYIVKPEKIDMRTKEGKAWSVAAGTRNPITEDDFRRSVTQARRIRALPEVGALLSEGVGEASAFWVDKLTGEWCKCRPDWVSPAGDGVILLDGKTSKDASQNGFSRAIWNWRYDLQAAWYSEGYEAATGKPVHGFVFAVTESDWPHASAAYILDDVVLEAARRECRRLLDQYAECRRSESWPGYPETIQPITLPAWAMKEIENE